MESDRIEFKSGWNPDAIYRSICAFANDFDNIGGGYIVVGVEDDKGRAKRPVKGLDPEQLDAIQRQMIGLNNLIRPYYPPKLYIEQVDDKQILVLWVPGGNDRPYEVPEQVTAKEKRYAYYIRRYASSIRAEGRDRQELLELSRKIPFDDRFNPDASIDDISWTWLREYLRVVKSRLLDEAEGLGKVDLLNRLNLLGGPPERPYPKNVALMLFCEQPERFFPYTYIDVVHFPKGRTEPFTEKQFKGPVQQQLKDALSFIRTIVLLERVQKVPMQAEADRHWNYPYEALEEILGNSTYHRDYQEHEPTTVRIEPDRITVYNLGGPDRSIKPNDFVSGHINPKRYRNRRLGDFLKELDLAEGRATGISAVIRYMRNNGSPDPIFEFDDDRTWFQVTLPIHPAFLVHDVESGVESGVESRISTILEVIRRDPQVSKRELIAITNASKNTIDRDIQKLRQAGKLHRIGPAKGGYWEIR